MAQACQKTICPPNLRGIPRLGRTNVTGGKNTYSAKNNQGVNKKQKNVQLSVAVKSGGVNSENGGGGKKVSPEHCRVLLKLLPKNRGR